jgi:hypothetical protein
MPPSAWGVLKLAITKTHLEALDPAELAHLAATSSSNTLADCEPTCCSLFSASQLQQLVLRSAAAAAAHAISDVSPCMKAVLASASSPGSSYFGTLDFLDSQIAFDVISSARPIPLLVAASPLEFLSTLFC